MGSHHMLHIQGKLCAVAGNTTHVISSSSSSSSPNQGNACTHKVGCRCVVEL